MNVYLLTFESFPPKKVIADNIIEAINKYQAYCINKKLNEENRLNNMTSIKLIEKFDYIQ